MAEPSTTDVTFLRALGLYISIPDRIIICTHDSCGYAIQRPEERARRHLWEKHEIPKASRRGLDSVIKALGLSNPCLISSTQWIVSTPSSEALSGYACRRCGDLTTSSKLHQQHQCLS